MRTLPLKEYPYQYAEYKMAELASFIRTLAQAIEPDFVLEFSPEQLKWHPHPDNQTPWDFTQLFHNARYDLRLEQGPFAIVFHYEEYPHLHREGATFFFEFLTFEVLGLPEGTKISGRMRPGDDKLAQLLLEIDANEGHWLNLDLLLAAAHF
ncbi:MAG: hypothetical protein HC913_17455 [Microscillaceae bacterium]|nr:hypothetical protein [Microscillaceae bacterium]